MNPTRAKLLDATAEVLRYEGLSGVAARPIAARAGVNQALIFYHFGSVADLVDAALRRSVDTSVAGYRDQFAAVRSLTELLDLGSGLHARERETGNVAIMAQVMAGALHDDVAAAGARYALDAWTVEIEAVVQRVLTGSPLAEVADGAGLARAIVGAFLGLELFDGVDPAGAAAAMSALDALGVLVEVMEDLGPVARRALRSRVRRRRSRS